MAMNLRLKAVKRLRDDLELYAHECLRIRTKTGAILPLDFNSSQRFLHAKLEAQLESTDSVRALVLEARQVGVRAMASIDHWPSDTRNVTPLDKATLLQTSSKRG